MRHRSRFLALIACTMFAIGCGGDVVAPGGDDPAPSDRHAPMHVDATVMMVVDYTSGWQWKTGDVMHGLAVRADYLMEGIAGGDPAQGVGTCYLSYAIDLVTGDGWMTTTDAYKLQWESADDCFVGHTRGTIDDFVLTGTLRHDGRGQCAGMDVQASFQTRWGACSYPIRGLITK